MTQLTLNIETPSMEHKLRSIIKNLIGVHIVANKTKKEAEAMDHSTENFIAAFAGAWHGSETAEQIISNIRETHDCKPPVAFD